MYAISNDLNTILHQSSRVLDVYCTIDGTTYDSSYIVDYSIESSLTDDGTYKIGCATSKTLSLTLVNIEATGWKGKEVKIYQKVCNQVGVTNPESATSYDTITMGVFYVYDTEISKLAVKLNCFDAIALLGNEKYKSTLTYPTAINNVMNELITRYHVIFDKLYSTSNIASMKATNVRQALQFIAVHLGANVGTNRNGAITFLKPVATTFSVDGDNYTNLIELDNNAQILSNLIATIDGVEHEVGDDSGITLKLMEDVVSNATELDKIEANSNLPFVYRAFEVELQGMPHLDVGDIITVIDVDNVSHNIPIFTQTFTFNGGMVTKINANPYSEDEEMANGGVTSVTSSIREINADVGNINKIFTERLVADYIDVDTEFANKVFAQEITAQGTITGASLIGGSFTATDETSQRTTTINKNVMELKGQARNVQQKTTFNPGYIQLKDGADTFTMDIEEGKSHIDTSWDLDLSVNGDLDISTKGLYMNTTGFYITGSPIELGVDVKAVKGTASTYVSRFDGSKNTIGDGAYATDLRGNAISFNGTSWKDLFTWETYTEPTVTSTSSGNLQHNATIDLTKSGWYPLSITGFDANGTGASYTFFSCCKLKNQAVGSCQLEYDWRCTSTSTSKSITTQFTVLWVKII